MTDRTTPAARRPRSPRRGRRVAPVAVALAASAFVTVQATTVSSQAAPGTASPGATATGRPLEARPVAGPTARRLGLEAVAALRARPGIALLSRGTGLASTSALRDSDGAAHVRLARTFRGLPVLGGDLVVHQDAAGRFAGVSQTLTSPLRLGTAPRVGRADARAAALARSAATDDLVRQQAVGRPALVVDAVDHAPRLAWQVVTTGRRSDGTPSRLDTLVDARTGAVLRREEHVETVDGTGRSLWSGTVPLQVSTYGSGFALQDATRGGTYTNDFQNKTDSQSCASFGTGCKPGVLVTSPTTTFGTGSTADRTTVAADAQYGTNETWDYYQQVHGRNGIFGTGAGSWNRVHYGRNYVNAFWDGTKMTYGDGDGRSYGPLVSLDVAGHEMSHGVTENTAGLAYSGESGGLNEATSDIFGTMVEFFANNASDPGDYLIGEQFDLAKHLGFRRMDDPSKDGSSPDCYSPTLGSLDVHYSSGVGNHFFYLLAEGSGPKVIGGVQHNSPTCNGSTVTGIGRDAAQRIWFRALTVYMTSGTDYAGARTATLKAAADLFGAGSTQAAAVAAAWSAVAVG